MANKKPTEVDEKIQVDQILIDELDIETDESLTPSTKIEPTDDEDLLVEYILTRIEEELEIEFPDTAASKIRTVQDVYDLVATKRK